jgi:optic atrophy 3 protein
MRLRLGLLQDPAAIDRQIAREVKEAEARAAKAKLDAETPTVKTLEETQADEEAHKKTKDIITKRVEEREKHKPKPRIRPLSEAKAIETGANFISEAFLFLVAGGIIIFEQYRSRKKASNERSALDDRLDRLEEERDAMKGKVTELQKEIQELLAAKSEGQDPNPKESNETTHKIRQEGFPQPQNSVKAA